MRTYREIYCAESESEKRRKFAIFKKDVEAADNERRWRREQERRKRAAEPAKAPPGTAPKPAAAASPRLGLPVGPAFPRPAADPQSPSPNKASEGARPWPKRRGGTTI